MMARVLYSEFKCSLLLKVVSTNTYESMTFQLPCNLQHVDRVTAETLTPCQQVVYELPGFTSEFHGSFNRVGVAHVQDQAGSNERQLYISRQLDLVAESKPKQRFRLGPFCEVHVTVRCMTKELDLIYTAMSGVIALGIAQQGADRLSRLRQVVAEHAVRILRIIRIATSIHVMSYMNDIRHTAQQTRVCTTCVDLLALATLAMSISNPYSNNAGMLFGCVYPPR